MNKFKKGTCLCVCVCLRVCPVASVLLGTWCGKVVNLDIYFYILSSEPVQTDNTHSSLNPTFFFSDTSIFDVY